MSATEQHGTAIEWTQAAGFQGETWNPVTGCDRISPECDHCYAQTLASRLKRMGVAAYQNDGDPRTSGPGFALTLQPDRLEMPLRWRKPRMVFVNSMSDLFHKDVPYEYVASVFNAMARCPQHVFQVLTKRPKRMARLVSAYYHAAGQNMSTPIRPLPNVWLGTSIGLPEYAWRADYLRATPAAVRFVSAEPLIGPVAKGLDLTDVSWLIAGGESGPEHRPMDLNWALDLRDACETNGTAFFMKQDSGLKSGQRGRIPDDLWLKEWPT